MRKQVWNAHSKLVPPVRGGVISDIASSGIMTVLKNSATGFISVFMFFADVASDLAVIALLYNTANFIWAAMATSALVAQYVVMYLRCLPYMRATFGAASCLTVSFIWFGFPIGILILDFLMLLEPFGLLSVLPLPAWLKQFIPACKHIWSSPHLILHVRQSCLSSLLAPRALHPCLFLLLYVHTRHLYPATNGVRSPSLCVLQTKLRA